MHTQTIEDYLKTVYEIQTRQGKVATTVLADRLSISPASVTGMIKKLADMNLVIYEPYQGVVLTEAGQRIALEVIRHHRLVELYLAEALGVPWDQVHEEAEKWEHVLSEDLEDRMDALLGYPTADPHGAPIPDRHGTIAEAALDRLADLKPGQSATVAEVTDENPEMLRYLGSLGLFPRVQVSVLAAAPFDGPITVLVGDTEHDLGQTVARNVFVTEIGHIEGQ